jgi:hypothetical protein
MRHNAKLDALVTRNIADLEAAIVHAREVTDKRLFKAIHSSMREAADSAHWQIVLDEFDLWMAPRTWLNPGAKAPDARGWFSFDELYEEDWDEAETWVGAITGATSGVPKAAFFFRQDQLGKLAWKKLVKANEALRDELLRLGFSYGVDDSEFYLPIMLDPDELGAGFEQGSTETAFQSVRSGLAAIVASTPLFEQLCTALVQPTGEANPAGGPAPDADAEVNASPRTAPKKSKRKSPATAPAGG